MARSSILPAADKYRYMAAMREGKEKHGRKGQCVTDWVWMGWLATLWQKRADEQGQANREG